MSATCYASSWGKLCHTTQCAYDLACCASPLRHSAVAGQSAFIACGTCNPWLLSGQVVGCVCAHCFWACRCETCKAPWSRFGHVLRKLMGEAVPYHALRLRPCVLRVASAAQRGGWSKCLFRPSAGRKSVAKWTNTTQCAYDLACCASALRHNAVAGQSAFFAHRRAEKVLRNGPRPLGDFSAGHAGKNVLPPAGHALLKRPHAPRRFLQERRRVGLGHWGAAECGSRLSI